MGKASREVRTADHVWVPGWSLGTVKRRDCNFLHNTDGTEPDVSLDPRLLRMEQCCQYDFWLISDGTSGNMP